MTQQTERDALRKLAEAATPGPWAFGTFHRLLVVQADKHGYADKHSAIADIGAGSIPWDATADSMQEYNDAEYIAAANPAAVITLLDQLQSQAERIATLEDDVEYLQEDINAMCNAIHGYRWSGGAAEFIAECFAERDELRAQLAAIAATEPVARAVADKTNTGFVYVRVLADELLFGTKLFTRPMPAQAVKDAERYRWLREQHWSTDAIAVVLNPKQAVKLGYVCPSDSLLDETIDAAIAKGAK